MNAPEPIRLWHVDAFASAAFAGNPAAVCLLSEGSRSVDAGWMQQVAAELNLSETAFVSPGSGSVGSYGLRWFTPTTEVPLCGHATLAAAHALWEAAESADVLSFATLSGSLEARREAEIIWLDFPEQRPDPPTERIPGALARAFVPAALESIVACSALPEECYGHPGFLVELPTERAVADLVPRLDALRAPGSPVVIVTAKSDRLGIDFVSRFFGPCVGVDEDPVTGSAHCVLAPYWAERLGRRQLVGFQASARGGQVGVDWGVDGRVRLSGSAVTVARGELLV